MPPPPAEGFPFSFVEWKPGRLSGARIQRSAVRGLPPKAVAQIQTTFTFASLSTATGTDKATAKATLEDAVTDSLRSLRAKTERKELAKIIRLCDERVSECAGRLIEIAMRDLLAQFHACTCLPLPGETSAIAYATTGEGSAAAGGDLQGDLQGDGDGRSGMVVGGGEADEYASFTMRRHPRSERSDATTAFPIRLLPIRTELLVSSASQLEARLLVTRELVATLFAKAIGRTVVALQPAQRLGHLKPLQRLLERTTGNYYPQPPPSAPPRPAFPLEKVHELRGNWRPHVKWTDLRTALDAAVAHSFEVATAYGGRELRVRASILRGLLTPEQRAESEEHAERRRLAEQAEAAGGGGGLGPSLILDEAELLAHLPEQLRAEFRRQHGRTPEPEQEEVEVEAAEAAEEGGSRALGTAPMQPEGTVGAEAKPEPDSESAGGSGEFVMPRAEGTFITETTAAVAAPGAAAAPSPTSTTAAEAAEARAETEAEAVVPCFDGIAGAAAGAWGPLLRRLDAEMAAASQWESFTSVNTAPLWARSGLLQVDTAALVSTRLSNIGVALLQPQRSGPHHANDVLSACRVHAHTVVHEAQGLLVKADAKPADLPEYVQAAVDLKRAEEASEAACALPGRLEALHELLRAHGIAVPSADTAYIAALRGSSKAIEQRMLSIQARLDTSREGFTLEARGRADELLRGVEQVLQTAKRRGVFSVASEAMLVERAADESAQLLEATKRTDVPRVATWLGVLGQDSWLAGLAMVDVTACELRTCASAWALVDEWRTQLDTYLTTPLVKLQPKREALARELAGFDARAAKLDAAWRAGTKEGASLQSNSPGLSLARRLKRAAAKIAGPGERPTSESVLRRTRRLPAEGGTEEEEEEEAAAAAEGAATEGDEAAEEAATAPAPAGAGSGWALALRLPGEEAEEAEEATFTVWTNPVVGLILDELDAWRAVLPVVETLLHPKMRTAQWQKVFATVPPPLEVLKLHIDKALEQAGDDDVDEEAVRKKAAEELAKQRAPGAMCLKILWEHGIRTFLPAIKKQLDLTLEREKQAAATAAASSAANSKGTSPRKKRASKAKRPTPPPGPMQVVG